MERVADSLPQPSAPTPHPGAQPSWGAGPASPCGPPSGGPGTLPPLLLLVFSAGFFCAPFLVVLSPPGLQALETPSGTRTVPPPRLRGPPASSRGPGLWGCIWRDDGAAWAHHLEDAQDNSGPLPHQEDVSRSVDPHPGEGTGWGLGVAPRGPSRLENRTVPPGPEDMEQGDPPEGASRLSLEALTILLDIPF